MNYLIRLLFCMMLVGLVSCHSQYLSIAHYKEVKQCKNICLQTYRTCKPTCINNCRTCRAKANYSAMVHYDKYAHEEQVQGGNNTRDLNSYRDPLQCTKVTCDCEADMDVCVQNCTGVIKKQYRVIPNCT